VIFNRAKTIFAFETKVTISLNFTSPRSLFDLKQVKGCVCNEIITRGKLFYCPILLPYFIALYGCLVDFFGYCIEQKYGIANFKSSA
jgi:hypothetical protein